MGIADNVYKELDKYEYVKSVEFTGWGRSRKTDMQDTTVIINKTNHMSLSFSDLSGLGGISDSSYHPDAFKLVEKPNVEEFQPVRYRVKDIEKVSLKSVKIIYSDKLGDKE